MRSLIIALIVLAAPAQGQRIETLRSGIERQAAALPESAAPVLGKAIAVAPRDGLSFTSMAASGVLFAAAGLAAGGYAGYQLRCDNDDMDWCRLGGAILGGVIAETVMTPIGVHLVHKKGSLRRELLVAAGFSAVGLTVGALTFPGLLVVPFLLPPIHIVTTIAIERRAALPELGGQ